jgi:arginine exporter protein ArgO
MAFSDNRPTASRSPIQLAALVVGAVFLLVGVLGFVPGVTTHVGDLKFAGHTSRAELLGVFQVSILHNIVHLLFGVLGIVAARKFATSRTYLVAGGAVYLVLWVYGLVTDHESDANFVPLNDADNWLHLVLGVGMIALGLLLSRDRASRYADTRS